MDKPESVRVKVTETRTEAEAPVDEFERISNPTPKAVRGLGRMASRMADFQFGLMSMPLNLLPEGTRYHFKNSLREGILAFKTLVDEVADGVENGLNQSMERDKIRQTYKSERIYPVDPPFE